MNPAGGANYTIPLELLPGVNGLAPELSIVYSSNSGPGIAGYGWQIGGLSVIGRGPQTYYHDNAVSGVGLTTLDRFYLDGQRLVPTSGNYGDAGQLTRPTMTFSQGYHNKQLHQTDQAGLKPKQNQD